MLFPNSAFLSLELKEIKTNFTLDKSKAATEKEQKDLYSRQFDVGILGPVVQSKGSLTNSFVKSNSTCKINCGSTCIFLLKKL